MCITNCPVVVCTSALSSFAGRKHHFDVLKAHLHNRKNWVRTSHFFFRPKLYAFFFFKMSADSSFLWVSVVPKPRQNSGPDQFLDSYISSRNYFADRMRSTAVSYEK